MLAVVQPLAALTYESSRDRRGPVGGMGPAMVTHESALFRKENMRAKAWSCSQELVHEALGPQGVSGDRTFICGPPTLSPSPRVARLVSPSQTRLWLLPGREEG